MQKVIGGIISGIFTLILCIIAVTTIIKMTLPVVLPWVPFVMLAAVIYGGVLFYVERAKRW